MEQNHLGQSSRRPGRSSLVVGLARGTGEILEAQRLRHRVFAGELGARLPSRTPGVDHDIYDPFCEHLLVRDTRSGEVVGTYRILAPEDAVQTGYYAENEFDLTRLQHLRPRLVEIGRSCVHPDYRNGPTIMLLWSGLAEYMTRHGYDYLMGCASISMADGGHAAASLYNRLAAGHLGPQEYRVFPRCPLPLAALQQDRPAAVPPLIKGYLRAGAWICGEPAWDPDFNTADLPILLPMARVAGRYAKHYLGQTA
ncbi:GNAT family N-acyltransferase [Azonexus sp.]|jgi:putative hemolysin|uniref:GNAT family N-acetyltransferase n=1 Tax=Azonexus sp. TaxID=1872668 RepID=UPI0028269165|nr:GNAT family N-acyltransferase [Azonexus sp.]MDR1995743.1 GNAT family N-acetyltransferase [Azonexus sp.]